MEWSRVPGIFETAIQQATSSVGTLSSKIWDPSNTSATTYGPLGSVPSGAVLNSLLIINTGTTNMYVGMGSAAVATTLGLLVTANGGECYLPAYASSGTTGSPNAVWANTGTVGLTTSALVGMASVPSVV